MEKRKTINGEDILVAMSTLGFDNYVEPLKLYLQKYREVGISTFWWKHLIKIPKFHLQAAKSDKNLHGGELIYEEIQEEPFSKLFDNYFESVHHFTVQFLCNYVLLCSDDELVAYLMTYRWYT